MFIINSDRDNVANIDRIESIRLEGRYVVAISTTGRINLGVYASENRANEVFKEMLKDIFTPMMFMQNCEMDADSIKSFKENRMGVIIAKDSSEKTTITRLDCGVYYMPEE